MRLKLFIGSAITAAVLSLAGPASAGGTTGGTDCSNTNFGSVSIGQGTVQCNNVNVTPSVNVSPIVKL